MGLDRPEEAVSSPTKMTRYRQSVELKRRRLSSSSSPLKSHTLLLLGAFFLLFAPEPTILRPKSTTRQSSTETTQLSSLSSSSALAFLPVASALSISTFQQPVCIAAGGAWEWYKTCLAQRPLLTKATTAAVLSSVSDALTQTVERQKSNEKKKNIISNNAAVAVAATASSEPSATVVHNWIRTLHIFITGFFYSGPMAHYWYQLLEHLCQNTHILQTIVAQSPWHALGTRTILDALLFSPATVAGYFVVRSALERQGPLPKLRSAWSKTVVNAWKFWPAVNLVSFGVVPLPYRVLYANVMSLLWTGYLSFVNQKEKKMVQDQ